MSVKSLSLGPFDLLEPIGAGGMAEVWRATHRVQGLPVAVKVITRGQAREPQILAAFRNEVRAVAGLDHPHVVLLLDAGEVPLEADAASQGRLIAGSPYLVMELASGGTLAGHEGPISWPTLRRALLTLLDALAHAHARGVVHLDLKPHNVLISGKNDLRPGLKLTDFGIAHAIDYRRQSGKPRGVGVPSGASAGGDGAASSAATSGGLAGSSADGSGRTSAGASGASSGENAAGPTAGWEGPGERAFVGGTPYYMAPEQVRGEWREFGPWTDLYALGCLGYELATGSPPFLADSPVKVCAAHCLDAPPPLRPRAPVPRGFAEWLSSLLEKGPERRFRRAADAAWALMQLGEARDSDEIDPVGWVSFNRPPPALAALLGSVGFATLPTLVRPAGLSPTAPQDLAATEARRSQVPEFQATRLSDRLATSSDTLAPAATVPAETLPPATAMSDRTFPPAPAMSGGTFPPARAISFETLATDPDASFETLPPGGVEYFQDAPSGEHRGSSLLLSATMLMAPPGLPLGSETWVTIPESPPRDADPGLSGERAAIPGTPGPGTSAFASAALPQRPPLPDTWRNEGTPDRPLPLIGAGLGLYPLRTLPLVDRVRERDAIWNALREARASNSARLVLVRGSAGHGKSRLVEWMGERADELGAAMVLKAFHSPGGGMTDGLAGMLVRHLRCTGLDRWGALARVSALLQRQGVTDDYEWQALTEIMSPALAPAPDGAAGREVKRIHFGSPTERFVVLQRLLERLGLERQVIVWLDDVQWGSEALGFVEHLLKSQRLFSSSILLLATVQNEALADRPLETSQIDRLALMDDATVVTVPPLAPEDHQALVQQLLHLEGTLAARVEARAGGNPLFAVQLVGDWVQRGVLEVGTTGFVLKPGEQALLPDDIHALWMAQVMRLLEDNVGSRRTGAQALTDVPTGIFRPEMDKASQASIVSPPTAARETGSDAPPPGLVAFELAAALGRQVDEAEWRAACLETLIEFPRTLLDSPATHRLLQPVRDTADGSSPPRWLFRHGMLRESLERSARESGRWPALNLGCMRMLERLHPPGTRGLDERVGRHALAARALELALGSLGRAAQLRWEHGEFPEAIDLLELRAEAMHSLELPESDPRWGEDQVLRALSYHRQGALDQGLKVAREAEAAARRHGWTGVRAKALVALGVALRWQGELQEARARLREALEIYEVLGDLRGAAEGWKSLAALEWELGDAERGQRGYLESLRCAREAGDPHTEVGCLLGLAQLAWTHQEVERARDLIEEAMALAERTGNQFGAAEAMRLKGQVAMRSYGDLEQATEIFRGAMVLYSRIGVQFGVSFCLNELAEAARLSGDLDAAEADYRRSLEIVEAIRPGTGYLQRYNLALTLLERGDYLEARRLLQICRSEVEASSRLRYLGSIFAALLVCDAAAQDWEAWDGHFTPIVELLGDNDEIDADDAGLLERAGSLAFTAGEGERARAAWRMAGRMWRALKQEARALEVEAK